MEVRAKRVFWSLVVLAFILAGGVGTIWFRLAPIGTAYKAKILCTNVFLAGRDAASVLGEDLSADGLEVLKAFDVTIDRRGRSVTSSILGLAARTAVFREGLGCTLVIGTTEEQLRAQSRDSIGTTKAKVFDRPRPAGPFVAADDLSPGVDGSTLLQAVDDAFSEPDPDRPRRTRAVVVVYQGRIIAEQYAPGFSRDMPLLGWSMTKSVTHALAGILVAQGKLSLEDNELLPAWRAADDPRRGITLENLLHMESGLEFAEEYGNPLEDVTYMLVGTGDAATYAAEKPLEAAPGSRWAYSSGTTNIITRIFREAIGGTDADYFAFPSTALFDRIGMRSAVIEPDAAGTFIGSSFMYATARDWARFGLLYLHDGVWEGERILPEGWVAYARTPAPTAPSGVFGAHFWLGVPRPYASRSEPRPELPADAFHMAGHEGQLVSVIPSRELVVVRLGLSREAGSWDHETFLVEILAAIR